VANAAGAITLSARNQVLKGPIPAISANSVIAFALNGTPAQNPIPAITDGTEIWSQAITPTATTTAMQITTNIQCAAGNNVQLALALFRGNTCIGVAAETLSGNGVTHQISMYIVDLPGSVASQTYSMRCGAANTNTWWVNSSNGSAVPYGGMLASANTYSITEYNP
jgi:hypothetical protein